MSRKENRMNQIKLLKLKIKNSNVSLDQKLDLYHQSKEAMHFNRMPISLLCLGAFSAAFTWAFLSKFSNPIFKIGKNIAKIGLKKVLL